MNRAERRRAYRLRGLLFKLEVRLTVMSAEVREVAETLEAVIDALEEADSTKGPDGC